MRRGTLSWAHAAARVVNDWPSSWNGVMVSIGLLGSQWAGVAAVAAAFITRYYRLALRLAISILVAMVVGTGAKHIIGRERPAAAFSDIHARIYTSGSSFPSSHVTIVTVIFLSLLPYMPNRWRWVIPVAVVGVMLSALYEGVGLPLDMVGGLALGVFIVALIRVLPQPLRIFLRID